MTRLTDWRSRLHAYLAASARRPFRPGAHDCGLFVGGAIGAMTGRDPTDWIRGTYRTLDEAQTLLRARGYEDHVALFAEGRAEAAPAFAALGDLVVLHNEEGELVMGLALGARLAVLRVAGLAHLPLSDAERAYRV